MTPHSDLNLSCIDNLPANSVRLIKLFARMEFALKAAGFLKPGQVRAEPHWDRFANNLGEQFWVLINQKCIAETIINSPPSLQINQDGMLAWQTCVSRLNSNNELIVSIRRIRNNLLHGGKSGDKDADRNAELISEAIEVLKQAVLQNEDVRIHFEGQY